MSSLVNKISNMLEEMLEEGRKELVGIFNHGDTLSTKAKMSANNTGNRFGGIRSRSHQVNTILDQLDQAFTIAEERVSDYNVFKELKGATQTGGTYEFENERDGRWIVFGSSSPSPFSPHYLDGGTSIKTTILGPRTTLEWNPPTSSKSKENSSTLANGISMDGISMAHGLRPEGSQKTLFSPQQSPESSRIMSSPASQGAPSRPATSKYWQDSIGYLDGDGNNNLGHLEKTRSNPTGDPPLTPRSHASLAARKFEDANLPNKNLRNESRPTPSSTQQGRSTTPQQARPRTGDHRLTPRSHANLASRKMAALMNASNAADTLNGWNTQMQATPTRPLSQTTLTTSNGTSNSASGPLSAVISSSYWSDSLWGRNSGVFQPSGVVAAPSVPSVAVPSSPYWQDSMWGRASAAYTIAAPEENHHYVEGLDDHVGEIKPCYHSPDSSQVTVQTSSLQPQTTNLQPQTSKLQPQTSTLQPQISHASSQIRPQVSHASSQVISQMYLESVPSLILQSGLSPHSSAVLGVEVGDRDYAMPVMVGQSSPLNFVSQGSTLATGPQLIPQISNITSHSHNPNGISHALKHADFVAFNNQSGKCNHLQPISPVTAHPASYYSQQSASLHDHHGDAQASYQQSPYQHTSYEPHASELIMSQQILDQQLVSRQPSPASGYVVGNAPTGQVKNSNVVEAPGPQTPAAKFVDGATLREQLGLQNNLGVQSSAPQTDAFQQGASYTSGTSCSGQNASYTGQNSSQGGALHTERSVQLSSSGLIEAQISMPARSNSPYGNPYLTTGDNSYLTADNANDSHNPYLTKNGANDNPYLNRGTGDNPYLDSPIIENPYLDAQIREKRDSNQLPEKQEASNFLLEKQEASNLLLEKQTSTLIAALETMPTINRQASLRLREEFGAIPMNEPIPASGHSDHSTSRPRSTHTGVPRSSTHTGVAVQSSLQAQSGMGHPATDQEIRCSQTNYHHHSSPRAVDHTTPLSADHDGHNSHTLRTSHHHHGHPLSQQLCGLLQRFSQQGYVQRLSQQHSRASAHAERVSTTHVDRATTPGNRASSKDKKTGNNRAGSEDRERSGRKSSKDKDRSRRKSSKDPSWYHCKQTHFAEEKELTELVRRSLEEAETKKPKAVASILNMVAMFEKKMTTNQTPKSRKIRTDNVERMGRTNTLGDRPKSIIGDQRSKSVTTRIGVSIPGWIPPVAPTSTAVTAGFKAGYGHVPQKSGYIPQSFVKVVPAAHTFGKTSHFFGSTVAFPAKESTTRGRKSVGELRFTAANVGFTTAGLQNMGETPNSGAGLGYTVSYSGGLNAGASPPGTSGNAAGNARFNAERQSRLSTADAVDRRDIASGYGEGHRMPNAARQRQQSQIVQDILVDRNRHFMPTETRHSMPADTNRHSGHYGLHRSGQPRAMGQPGSSGGHPQGTSLHSNHDDHVPVPHIDDTPIDRNLSAFSPGPSSGAGGPMQPSTGHDYHNEYRNYPSSHPMSNSNTERTGLLSGTSNKSSVIDIGSGIRDVQGGIQNPDAVQEKQTNSGSHFFDDELQVEQVTTAQDHEENLEIQRMLSDMSRDFKEKKERERLLRIEEEERIRIDREIKLQIVRQYLNSTDVNTERIVEARESTEQIIKELGEIPANTPHPRSVNHYAQTLHNMQHINQSLKDLSKSQLGGREKNTSLREGQSSQIQKPHPSQTYVDSHADRHGTKPSSLFDTDLRYKSLGDPIKNVGKLRAHHFSAPKSVTGSKTGKKNKSGHAPGIHAPGGYVIDHKAYDNDGAHHHGAQHHDAQHHDAHQLTVHHHDAQTQHISDASNFMCNKKAGRPKQPGSGNRQPGSGIQQPQSHSERAGRGSAKVRHPTASYNESKQQTGHESSLQRRVLGTAKKGHKRVVGGKVIKHEREMRTLQ